MFALLCEAEQRRLHAPPLGRLLSLRPVIVTSICLWLQSEPLKATTDYIGGNKPNWPKSEVISQNVQERVILPFLSCDVVLPTIVAVLPVGGIVPPEGHAVGLCVRRH